jgi:hypothetical protein
MPMLQRLWRITAAASLLTSGACSTTPTAPASPTPPAACLARCEIPDRPPQAGDQKARNAWEHETLKRFGACSALHDECADKALERIVGADR